MSDFKGPVDEYERLAQAIDVNYEVDASAWKLTVADNGVGSPAMTHATGGLGTSIVNALAKQLGAQVSTKSDAAGASVSVTHSNFRSPAKGP